MIDAIPQATNIDKQVKNPGPQDQALISPHRGAVQIADKHAEMLND